MGLCLYIYPGNTSSLWKAVKKANDVNTNNLPQMMYENKFPLVNSDLPDKIAQFLNNKISRLTEEINISEEEYNGMQKVTP